MQPISLRPLNYGGLKFSSTAAWIIVIVLIAAANIDARAQQKETTKQQVVHIGELNWGPPGGSNGFPVGVRTARQGIDPTTGGITYYALFPAGSHFDLHRHTFDEFVVVVSGALEIQLGERQHDLTVGSYIVIPGSLEHAWTVPQGNKDAIILVRRAGPADFEFVD